MIGWVCRFTKKMALFFISACAVVICIFITVLLNIGNLHNFFVRKKSTDTLKQISSFRSSYTLTEVLSILKKSKLFPVGPSQGWTLTSFQHGHRVWSHRMTDGSDLDGVQVLAAYSKVNASSQVILQLLKDVGRTSEWCPGVVSSTQIHPPAEDPGGNTGSNPSPPILSDEVTEVVQIADNQRTKHAEHAFNRCWHREDNGCCWLIKMDQDSQTWTFFLAQPAEDVDHSLLTIVMLDNPPGGATVTQAAILLGCLEEQLSYRKAQFTPLMSISLPSVHHSDETNTIEPPHSDHELPIDNNNHSKEEVQFFSKVDHVSSDKKLLSHGGRKGDDKKTHEFVASYSVLRHRKLNCSIPKASSETEISKNYNGSEDSSESSSEDHPPPLSETELANRNRRDIIGNLAQPIRRVESDSNLFRKERSKGEYENFNSVPRNEEERRKRRHMILANQAAAELLAQVFKASAVELSKNQNVKLDVTGGWIFCGYDNDIVVLKRRLRYGLHTQSFMGKGIVRATPKAVWDAVRNPRMKFTYDESLKKVDILHSVSETTKIVYFYHEVVQIFRKDCCDFCVLQSERLEGKKYILSIQSIDWETSPATDGVTRGKLLPSGWIVEPVMKDNKVFSMVTFLMQMDMGGGKGGNNLPFEDLASRQPQSIVQLREYFKPLAIVVERSRGTMTC